MNTERRKFHRISGSDDPCTLQIDHNELAGVLSDESISGAKISQIDLLMLPFNKPMKLVHRGGHLDVQARNVKRTEDDTLELGVIRSEMLSEEQRLPTNSMLVNCYVAHHGACVICMPVHVESEEQALIQLWDGVQFRVPRSQLRSMTRPERFEMLADERCQLYTAAMYGLSPCLLYTSPSPRD